jgi:hypothetical protein
MTFQEWYKDASTGYVNLSEDSARVGWNAALNCGALKPTTNTARNAIALVRQFARVNGHSEGGVMDQYLDRLEGRATASVA